MTPFLHVEITGNAEEKLRKIEQIEKKIDKILMVILAYLKLQIRLTFVRQASPWGQPWKPLSGLTLKLRQIHGIQSTQILLVTGTLRDDVHISVSGRTGTIQTGPATRDYARAQQYGAVITPKRGKYLKAGGIYNLKRVVIPARPFFPIRRDRVDLPPQWVDGASAVFAHQVRLVVGNV